MKKFVIYTSLTGGYDDLVQLTCVSDEFDYICFTDSDIDHSQKGIWTLRQIPKVVDDKQRLSRYPKMHPHVLLSEYEYSIYIDANVDIINNEVYKIFKDKIKNDIILSGVKHPLRKCTYNEFFVVYRLRKETNLSLLKKEYKYLKKEGFPVDFGMFEAGMILRKHNDIRIIVECERWWLMYNLFSQRDQLCYVYTLWKSNIKLDYLPGIGLTRPNAFCRLINHTSIEPTHGVLTRIKKEVIVFMRKNEDILNPIFKFYLSI